MTKPDSLEAVSLQLPSKLDYRTNLDRLTALIQKHRTKDIILAPEVCLSTFDYDKMGQASDFSLTALDALRQQVDDQIVALTLILREQEAYVNRAVVIHQHRIVYWQDKAKLFRLGDEDRYFQAGRTEEIKIFEINGVKYGILICFELRFKELWKQLEGVDVVLIPARWGLLRKSHLEILSRALAVMNQCYVIVSDSSDGDMAASSAIIAPDGTAIQDDRRISLTGRIDFRMIKKIRRYIVME